MAIALRYAARTDLGLGPKSRNEDSGYAGPHLLVLADGMGGTTIAMLRTGNKLAMAHIGDSRADLLRDGKLSQITKDHSFVQQLVDEHRITPEEAEDHPQRSLVTRVMTGQADDEPDLSMRELRA